jgi:hypothetical protein
VVKDAENNRRFLDIPVPVGAKRFEIFGGINDVFCQLVLPEGMP